MELGSPHLHEASRDRCGATAAVSYAGVGIAAASTTATATDASTGLPDFAPIPSGAYGPALNPAGYFVGCVDGNLYWVTDGFYQ